MSKFPIAVPQCNRLSENAGNVAEAPPVADKARRCWRKTRSIAPAPRAIGDYVLRGLCGVLLRKPSPRTSKKVFKHCGATIGSLITKVGLVTYFYFAKVRETGLLLSV